MNQVLPPNATQLVRDFRSPLWEIVRLRRELKTAAVRMAILADRMEGCNAGAGEEGRKPTHELLPEARWFADETRKAILSNGAA